MIIKNSRKIKVFLHFDEHKKIEAFVALIAQIDKRISSTGKETKKAKMKKAKDALLGLCRKGSQKCGPFLFLINTLSFLTNLYETCSIVSTYDRHGSFTYNPGYTSSY